MIAVDKVDERVSVYHAKENASGTKQDEPFYYSQPSLSLELAKRGCRHGD